ncbi:MAG: hypothetical protein AB7O66_10770 [Limisphaerales bacterium]
MSRIGKQDKTAGNGEQKLPETAVSPAASVASVGSAGQSESGSGAGSGTGSGRDQADKHRQAEKLSDELLVNGLARNPGDKAVGEKAPVGEVTPGIEERVNRIEELITREVVRFRWTGQESVSVTIRPEQGTEIVVHLRQREGQIEAELGLTRGDAARFQGHWQQLNDALAEQNVRLVSGKDMAPPTSMTGTGSGSHQGMGMGMGPGLGSGSGSGSGQGGHSSQGQSQGTEPGWRENPGGTTTDHGSSDRRRAPEVQMMEAERSGSGTRRNTPPRRALRAAGSVARPEGWEFWA